MARFTRRVRAAAVVALLAAACVPHAPSPVDAIGPIDAAPPSTSWVRAGTILPRDASDGASRHWGIGAETMDRAYTRYESWAPYAPALGVTRARVQGGWARTEAMTKGTYNFTWLDPPVRGLAAAGVQPWLQLSYGNPLYGPLAGDPTTTSIQPRILDSPDVSAAWAGWVSAMCHRYGDVVDTWEVWNEPSLHEPNVTAYGALVLSTARTLRACQPQARVFVQIAGNVSFAADTLAYVVKHGGGTAALDLVAGVTFHPYESDPDNEYTKGVLTHLNDTITAFASHLVPVQGESGAPSQPGGHGALASGHWNETSQAKWALRRMLGDVAHGLTWTSLFSIADMCYIDKGKLNVNHKGLLLVNCTAEGFPVLRPKQAYYSVQALTAVFGANTDVMSSVGAKRLYVRGSDGRNHSVFVAPYVARAKGDTAGSAPCDSSAVAAGSVVAPAGGGTLMAVWVDGDDMPSGNATLTNAPTFATQDIVPATVGFSSDVVLVDLRLGAVLEHTSYNRSGGTVMAAGAGLPARVPLYDSPVVLADLAALPPWKPNPTVRARAPT